MTCARARSTYHLNLRTKVIFIVFDGIRFSSVSCCHLFIRLLKASRSCRLTNLLIGVLSSHGLRRRLRCRSMMSCLWERSCMMFSLLWLMIACSSLIWWSICSTSCCQAKRAWSFAFCFFISLWARHPQSKRKEKKDTPSNLWEYPLKFSFI